MKKLNNKGFSLVELIIVIAIMAILAAALAPQLIKYIEKSRISSDKTAAASVKSAFDSAIANEDAYDAAINSSTHKIQIATAADLSSSDALEKEMAETLQDLKAPKSKVGKNGGQYTLEWSVENNKISQIKYGTNTLGDASSDVMEN
jgi:type IV pilus assembly protein PilA